MRAADWRRLSKPVLAATEVEWRWARALAYIHPLDWVVHGLLAEDSGNRPGEFYLWIVRMPLMVPMGRVPVLSWSDRYRGGTTTYDPGSSVGVIAEAASIAIANARKGGLLLDPPGGADNVRMQEARAYGLVLSGDERGALEVLRRISTYEATHPWEEELLGRAASVEESIRSGKAQDAMAFLRGWRDENCAALGLSCD